MKPRNYIILMVACIGAMLFMSVAPCRAEWVWIEGASGFAPEDLYGSEVDNSNNHYYWTYYDIQALGNGGSGGVTATLDGDVAVYMWGGGENDVISGSKSQNANVWARSEYRETNQYDPNTIYIDHSVSLTGSVSCSGSLNLPGLSSSGSIGSSSEIKCWQEEGPDEWWGLGSGSASGDSSKSFWSTEYSGSAYTDTDDFGWAVVDYESDYVSEDESEYSASLDFHVNLSESRSYDWMTSLTVYTDIELYSSGSLYISAGRQYVSGSLDANASGGGTTTMSVSW